MDPAGLYARRGGLGWGSQLAGTDWRARSQATTANAAGAATLGAGITAGAAAAGRPAGPGYPQTQTALDRARAVDFMNRYTRATAGAVHSASLRDATQTR